jgi:large subunit ribosomal protein L29
MKMKELRELSNQELNARLKDEIAALRKLQFTKVVNGQIENPARIKVHKKTIARIKTLIKQRETV